MGDVVVQKSESLWDQIQRMEERITNRAHEIFRDNGSISGRDLDDWFRAESERKAQVGLDERDDFNLLLTWFRNAQSQCASGQTARAVENFQAVEALIAKRVEQHQPADED